VCFLVLIKIASNVKRMTSELVSIVAMDIISVEESVSSMELALMGSISIQILKLVRLVILLVRLAQVLRIIVLLVIQILLLLWSWIPRNWNIYMKENVYRNVLWELLLIIIMIRNVWKVNVSHHVSFAQENLINVIHV